MGRANTMKIYTRTGDSGETSLLGGTRVQKNHPRLETCGTLDELNTWLGEAVGRVSSTLNDSPSKTRGVELRRRLIVLQNWLFNLGSQLAAADASVLPASLLIGSDHVGTLETWIDEEDSHLPKLTEFILPGGHPVACALHMARTVARRAERQVTKLKESESMPPELLKFMNRLSDYLFVAARTANSIAQIHEPTWQKTGPS